ncbi:MAG TPA: FAD-dependent oxidoreductase [Candidatus Polarisedimenticolia bacterium]|jgi:glycine/D-amino acid oxidase-like deaminating enzyme|nr:FAD-dependent oxidoreductase [Candidatus Polarisedimenticolia bacterium]
MPPSPSMQPKASVVVVGAGIMGASVAYHLAARGVTDILIIDRTPGPMHRMRLRKPYGLRRAAPARSRRTSGRIAGPTLAQARA